MNSIHLGIALRGRGLAKLYVVTKSCWQIVQYDPNVDAGKNCATQKHIIKAIHINGFESGSVSPTTWQPNGNGQRRGQVEKPFILIRYFKGDSVALIDKHPEGSDIGPVH